MTKQTSHQLTLTLQGETRTIEAKGFAWDAERLFGAAPTFYGVFPTGSKAHPMEGTFHRCVEREDGKVCLVQANGTLRFVGFGATVARDENGTPWLLEATLYTHNRNVGRLAGWLDKVPAERVATWGH